MRITYKFSQVLVWFIYFAQFLFSVIDFCLPNGIFLSFLMTYRYFLCTKIQFCLYIQIKLLKRVLKISRCFMIVHGITIHQRPCNEREWMQRTTCHRTAFNYQAQSVKKTLESPGITKKMKQIYQKRKPTTRFMQKQLGKKQLWQKVHRCIFPSGILVFVRE